jgi:hypothetical protein
MVLDFLLVPSNFGAGEALSLQFPAEYLPDFGVYGQLAE